MSIASAITAAQGRVAAAYDSCDLMGATMPPAADQDLSHLPATIESIPTGGGCNPEAEENDVIFIDYDGTIRYSYSKDDFAALTALPANPTHEGLTALGWNWTLADAQAYVASYGILVIGQMYVTDNGKTRLYIVIADEGRMDVPLHLYSNSADNVEIDWGDGSATELSGAAGVVEKTHTYASPGTYIISLRAISGTYSLGGGSASWTLVGANNNAGRVYANMLKRVEVGTSVEGFRLNALQGSYSLSSITIPTSVTVVSNNTFQNCVNLQALVIPTSVTSFSSLLQNAETRYLSFPKEVTSVGNSFCTYSYAPQIMTLPPSITTTGSSIAYSMYALRKIVIPEGVTTIGPYAFYGCSCLSKLVFPSTVTSIGNVACQNCYGLKEIVMLPSTPPTLGTGLLTNCPADLVIYVPVGSLAAYQGATGWSEYSSQIVEMPA